MNTSYFARFSSLPNRTGVAICTYPPSWFSGPSYEKLNPPVSTLLAYKHNEMLHAEYVEQYTLKVLSRLDPRATYDELVSRFGEDCVLLCYEVPSAFCHRHLVSRWFESRLGVEVPEYRPPTRTKGLFHGED